MIHYYYYYERDNEKTPKMRSPDCRGRRGKPRSHPARQGNISQVIPSVEGRLKSLAMYRTEWRPTLRVSRLVTWIETWA